ncbi:MAG: Mur ligase domain-containing protein, partial [Trichlorobacter sp.]
MFTEAEILQATGGRLVGAPFGTVSSVSSDSRSITHGQLFVALEGEHFNGHDYIQQALDCGAAACIVSERWAAAQAPV